ncbi:MAG: hypothetical protein MZV70_22145 [Desulfobacterales bacterium]|nr:hypothetical protein [Desulfobacterales bacterium]
MADLAAFTRFARDLPGRRDHLRRIRAGRQLLPDPGRQGAASPRSSATSRRPSTSSSRRRSSARWPSSRAPRAPPPPWPSTRSRCSSSTAPTSRSS